MRIINRGGLRQKISLASGLILFAFAATHFLNHALGLVQLEAMYEVQQWRWVVTRSLPGSIILGCALITHIVFGLMKLAGRATLRLPAWELVQIGLGLIIPLLLLPHIVNTRLASLVFGVADNYLYELARLWPASAATQSLLLLLVWAHGCLGIHFWLRLVEPYRRIQPLLLFIAIVVPLAALAGFMVGGRAVAGFMEDPAMSAQVREVTHWPSPGAEDALGWYRLAVRVGFLVVVLIVAALMAWRYFARLAAPKIRITYTGGPAVQSAVGPTLLEISRANDVPHASVCGGRARCATCRVRVDQGADSLEPAQFAETFTLASIGVPANTRLACQIRPRASLTVTRLLRPATTGPAAASVDDTDASGVEKTLVLMFLGIRDFAELSRDRLAYDVVFLLNEFYAAAGAAITEHHGWIDRFLGSGLLAVFGRQHGPDSGCRDALRAARAIDIALDRLNQKVAAEIGRPVAAAMGIHVGEVLLGRIGYGDATELTVVGSPVEAAIRLERFAEERGVQIAVSAAAARLAGLSDAALDQTVELAAGDGASRTDVIGIARGRDLDGAPIS